MKIKRVIVILLGAATWTWILYTLYVVGRIGGAVLVDPDTTGRIMGVRSGDHIDSALGLTYHGLSGAALVIVELVAVAAALVLTGRKPITWRRLGLVVLLAWTLLWLGNALWMESLSDASHVVRTSNIAAATIVVTVFTILRWPSIPLRRD